MYVCLQFHNALYGDAKGWARRLMSFLHSYVPGVMNPHAKVVQRWNQFFVISCLMAVFIDPLFFFLLSVQTKVSSFFFFSFRFLTYLDYIFKSFFPIFGSIILRLVWAIVSCSNTGLLALFALV